MGATVRVPRLLGLLAIVVLPLLVTTPVVADEIDAWERISELRCEGDFTQALEVARAIIAGLEGATADDPDLADGRRLEATLSRIRSLPPESQEELAQAECLKQRAERAYYDDDQDALQIIENASNQRIAILQEHLGVSHPEVAETHRLLAWQYDYDNRFASARNHYRSALSIFRQSLGEQHPSTQEVSLELAAVLIRLARFSEAEQICDRILEQHQSDGNICSICWQARRRLLDVWINQSEFSRATGAIRKLQATMQFSGMDSEDSLSAERDLRFELGKLQRMQGDYLGSEVTLRELVMLEELQNPSDRIATLQELASTLTEAGKREEAVAMFEQVEDFLDERAAEDPAGLGTFYNNLAMVLTDMHSYEAAERNQRKSIRLYTRAGVALGAAVVRLNLARNLREQGRYDEAETEYLRSWRELRPLVSEHDELLARHTFSHGGLYARMRRFVEAESMLVQAASLYDVNRQRMSVGINRSRALHSPYPLLSAVALHNGNEMLAWNALEKFHARSLEEMIALYVSGIPDELQAVRDSLLRAEEAFEAQAEALEFAFKGPPTPEQLEQLNRVQTKLNGARARRLEFDLQQSQQLRDSMDEQLTLPDLQASLAPGEALVQWLDVGLSTADFESWVCLVTGDHAPIWRSIHYTEEDFERAEQYLARASRPPNSLHSSSLAARDPRRITGAFVDALQHAVPREQRALMPALWRRLQPIADELAGIANLHVVPSGSMMGVPIEAIEDDSGVMLLDRFRISYVPSATLHVRGQQGRRPPPSGRQPFLLLGDPPFREVETQPVPPEELVVATRGAGLTTTELRAALGGDATRLRQLRQLPGTRREVEAIAEMCDDKLVLLGSDASEQRLRQLIQSDSLAGFRVLHLATHALLDDRRPDQSALVLSQVGLPPVSAGMVPVDRVSNGLVTAREVTREWRLNADLVTLSACETAVGEFIAGEGFLGLSHAFYLAGARSMVVSLWPVHDLSASLLMKRFYVNLLSGVDGAEGMDKAAALREAKQWLRRGGSGEDYSNPYHWAVFQLIGDPAPLH